MPRQPNILFILTDQMRPSELGPATPVLNRLADTGVRFEHCYAAAPLCQPSRNCIVTGRFPTQHGVCGNMNDPISDAERADTYPHHLQATGYHTAYIGKHHYIDRFNIGMDVVDDDEAIQGYGYDHVWQVVDISEGRHNDDRFTRFLAERGKLQQYRDNLGRAYFETLDPSETPDGYIADQAVAYLRQFDGKQPLMLTVGFVGPHPPHWAPEPYGSMFSPDDVPAPKALEDPERIRHFKAQRAVYRGQVRQIDDAVGRLLDMLGKREMRENTLIVFTADHGHMIGDYGIHDKRFFYEQSVRVPLVLSGAGVPRDDREPEKLSKALVSGVDLYPTFLDAAGCEYPHGAGKRDGLSLLRLVDGRTAHRGAVCSELGTATMVRDAGWKLVYDPAQGGVEQLFNLRRDPEELDNLAGLPMYRDVETRLVQHALGHMIRLTRHTHTKERMRLQRVRVE